MERTGKRAAEQRGISERPFLMFALIFTGVFLLHASLLRLPYFWDEAGYFVPAARDLLLTGSLIPHTTLSNAHPPLVMIWLAAWWKLSNFTPAVTRTAMLLVSAFALLGVWRLARQISNAKVASASVILVAFYPVFFAQSSLAQLDIPVAALVIWGTAMHIENRRVATILFLSLAPLAKETAVVTPLTLFAWELLCPIVLRRRPDLCLHKHKFLHTFSFLLCVLPLAAWYAYHYHRVGYIFGNPEFLRYNVGATLTPLRVVLAFVQRIWQAFGYMNLIFLTLPAIYAMRLPSVSDEGHERQRIAFSIQIIFGLLVLAHAAEFALLGGAVLARYMVPVIPLVIIICVSTLHRRLREWTAWVAMAAIAFVLALVINPPWRTAPEDNLDYSDFIRLHKQAATFIEKHYSQDRVLTAWPASDELNRPFLGYVSSPLTVVHVENFTAQQILSAAQQPDAFDVAFVFSTKYEPRRNFLSRFKWWESIQERYFDYHRDLTPETIAPMLHGRIVWQANRGGQWAAIIEIDKIRNAQLVMPRTIKLPASSPSQKSR